MAKHQLDRRLTNDCFILDEDDFAWILMMNNAAVPWFIIVPKVDVYEICDLSAEQQHQLDRLSRQLSGFIRSNYAIDKLNVAAIGNIVKQLHLHIIGRYTDDYCWPEVVWGQPIPERYTEAQTLEIKAKLDAYLN